MGGKEAAGGVFFPLPMTSEGAAQGTTNTPQKPLHRQEEQGREDGGKGGDRGKRLPAASSSLPPMAREGAQDVKVKVVVTRYVQTDATQFKNVVQNLTGKDAVVGEGAEGGWPVGDRKPAEPPGGAQKGDPPAPASPCREMESMLTEFPSLEELEDLWKD